MRRVLAFDQSTTTTGWCTFIDNNYNASGVIKTRGSTEDRLMYMAELIAAKIDDFRPNLVAIEDVFDKNNVATVVLLARLQGAIMLHCNEKGIPVKILGPNTWRKIVGVKKHKREEAKAEAVQLVKNAYGIDVIADEAEAICIGKACLV